MKFRISLNAIIIVAVVLAVLAFALLKKPVNRTASSGISSAGVSTKALIAREIKVTAKKYSFSPNPIRLKLNEQVRLRITSDDVPHGFAILELGIDQALEPGKESVVNLQPTKKGTFTVMCSIACGSGHADMRGSIIVE